MYGLNTNDQTRNKNYGNTPLHAKKSCISCWVEHYKYRSERRVDDTKHNSNKKKGGFVTELQNRQVQKWRMKNICVSNSKCHEFTSRQTAHIFKQNQRQCIFYVGSIKTPSAFAMWYSSLVFPISLRILSGLFSPWETSEKSALFLSQVYTSNSVF